jgi:hypothetical protein
VGLSGRFVGDGPGGVVAMGALVFRVKGSGSTTTVTGVRSFVSTTANGDFNYASRTRVVEGAYPSTSGLRASRR